MDTAFSRFIEIDVPVCYLTDILASIWASDLKPCHNLLFKISIDV